MGTVAFFYKEERKKAASPMGRRFLIAWTRQIYLISLLATSAWAFWIKASKVREPRSPSLRWRTETVPSWASLSPTTSI